MGGGKSIEKILGLRCTSINAHIAFYSTVKQARQAKKDTFLFPMDSQNPCKTILYW